MAADPSLLPFVDPGHQLPTLLKRLEAALAEQKVRYCQWLGHWERAKWTTGEEDAMLLVAPGDIHAFAAVAHQVGYRPASAAPDAEVPGVTRWYGYDRELPRFLRLHVCTRLIVGDDRRTFYRLPLEDAALGKVMPRTGFPTPRPEIELILFVVCMVLRRRLGDADACREELASLERQSDPDRLHDLLARHLPAVDRAVWDACRKAFDPQTSRSRRDGARRSLERALAANASPAPAPVAKRLASASGGLLVALVGADGAGKSTCAVALRKWLGPYFHTMHAHLGRPPRSLTTLLVGALRKIFPVPALNYLRHLCTARDRYRIATRTARFALQGGIALCERYPGAEHDQLVGPRIRQTAGSGGGTSSGLAEWLARIEEDYYRRLPVPDLRLILLVAPEVAVRRKTTEPAEYVRRRATLVWETEWAGPNTRVIDAGQPLPAVVAALQAALWLEL
jgi:thymidylate kinase